MHDLRQVSTLFDMRADFVNASPYGSGHINDTYCAWYDHAGSPLRFIHQRINHNVFNDPVRLMENIDRVTRHSLDRLIDENHPEAYRRTLTCVPAYDGKPFAIDAEGNFWRTYPFIERARGYDEIESNEQAYEAAKSIGAFQKLTADLPGERLYETIPDFHHTPKRLQALEAAIAADVSNRSSSVTAEIEFARARAAECSVLIDLIDSGKIPERVTHNDAKLNNILLDETTHEGVCVIDLDTTMPGSALYDFGDMVRSMVPSSREDEREIQNIGVRLDRFESLVTGYLHSATFLNETEKSHLTFSGKLLTLECGIRFLTDFLQGDVYFKTNRPSHNLDRCRNQFGLVRAIEENFSEMESIVQKTLNR